MNDKAEGVLRAVAAYWASEGLTPEPLDLQFVPESLRPRLPDEYEELVETIGVPRDQDRNGFRFWQPGELCTAADLAIAEAAIEPTTAAIALAELLVFTDYLDESWWYGIWLSGVDRGSVSLVTGVRDPRPPIATFPDFLSAYTKDDPILYRTD